MRIAIFSHEDYAFMFEVWSRFIPLSRERGHEVVGIALFSEILSKYRGLRRYMKLLEIFGFKSCAKIFILSVKKRLGFFYDYFRGSRAFATYRGLGKHLRIEILRADNPNQDKVIDWIREREIDVIILSVGYIIKKPLLQAVRLAVLNKHSSLLPANKGLLPVFWTLKEGSLPVGVSIHKVNEKIDEGEILLQQEYRQRLLSIFAYYEKIHNDLPQLLIRSLSILADQEESTTIAELPAASYHSLPSRNDYKDLLNKGYRLI